MGLNPLVLLDSLVPMINGFLLDNWVARKAYCTCCPEIKLFYKGSSEKVVLCLTREVWFDVRFPYGFYQTKLVHLANPKMSDIINGFLGRIQEKSGIEIREIIRRLPSSEIYNGCQPFQR